jgi:hypothetical protein
VFNRVQHGCKGSPNTFLGPLFSMGAIILTFNLPLKDGQARKRNFLRDP